MRLIELLQRADEIIEETAAIRPYRNEISNMVVGMERIRDLIEDALIAEQKSEEAKP